MLYRSIIASRLTYAACLTSAAPPDEIARTIFNGLNTTDRLAFGIKTRLSMPLMLLLAEPDEATMWRKFREAGCPFTDEEPMDYQDSAQDRAADRLPDALLVLVPLAALLLTSCRAESLTAGECVLTTLVVAAICGVAGALAWITERLG